MLLLSDLLPIGLRCGACDFSEDADEIGVVAESQRVCHLHHRLLFGEQQELRFLDFLAVNVLQWRSAHLLLEKPDEIGLRHTCHGGE